VLRSTQRRTEQTEEDAARVLMALSAAVLVIDRDGLVLFANARACEILGQSRGALCGAMVEELLVPLEVIRNAADTGGEERLRARTIRSDGSELVLGFRATPIESGKDLRWAICFQDIGAIERVGEERDRLMQIVGINEVLPAVLHELKNPLAAIDNAVELQIEEMADSPERVELHAILGEIRRMKLTLEGLGSLERDIHVTRSAAVDLALREVVRILDRQAAPRSVRLVADIPDMPLLPFAPSVVRAIAFNLITNALHACMSGDRIDVVARLVKSEDDERDFELEVRDDGCGMTPEVRERCTEPFFTTKPKGTGIGLALVSRIVRQAGGELAIASVPGAGTSVRIRIPVRRPRLSRPPPCRSGTHDAQR
jgi:PAS domain S-box-containing protein